MHTLGFSQFLFITQGVYKSSLTNFQKISRIHFFKIPEDFYATSHTITPEIIVILFTWGLPSRYDVLKIAKRAKIAL